MQKKSMVWIKVLHVLLWMIVSGPWIMDYGLWTTKAYAQSDDYYAEMDKRYQLSLEKIRMLEGEKRGLIKDILSLKAIFEELKSSIGSLIKENKEKDYRLSVLKQKIKRLDIEIDSLNRKLDVAGVKLEKSKIKRQRTVEKVKLLKKDLKKQNEIRKEQSSQIRKLNAEKRKQDSELKDAKEAQEMAEEEREALQQKLEALQDTVKKERADMHYNLGVVFDKDGMYKDAEREYLKCLELNEDDPDVHYNLGILYDDKLNENKLAMKHYQRFLEVKPKGENARQVRAWMLNIEEEERIGAEMR